ncbi:hypothetical protein [Brachyspira sp. SAP_772]|uniref:hypothetical protein n=1 Tax=Brachyspira sp. SAP_772 TaxID=2608385 RepID=UPI0012F4CCC6|nr:hypothetical protein [Brachyspira sp. SAP_772]
MKNRIYLIILLLLISCGKKENTLLEDMALLDKSYIRTLLYTANINNQNRKESIERFIIDWNAFKKKYYNANSEDPQWKADFDSLQDILIRSHYYIASGEDESAGYSILHDIKYVLSDMRKRNNINWFVDNINAIYKTANRMNELSKIYGLNTTVLTETEENRLIVVYQLLDSAVKNSLKEFDRSNIQLLGLTAQQIEALRHNMNTISDLVLAIGNNISNKKYTDIPNISANIINIYFNSLQIIVT